VNFGRIFFQLAGKIHDLLRISREMVGETPPDQGERMTLWPTSAREENEREVDFLGGEGQFQAGTDSIPLGPKDKT
jgi:hypothetical protein